MEMERNSKRQQYKDDKIMTRSLKLFSCTVLALFLNYTSQAAASIDISGYDSGGNFLGLAVDPVDHHVFLTGLG